jgi:hypothetical protein
MPTKHGHSLSIKTVDEDISSKDKFSVASGDKVGVLARMPTSTTRRREQPSRHA